MIDEFDKYIDRKNTNSLKWDYCKRVFGTDDLLPMWVADSDWKAPQVVIDAVMERVKHGIFGYTEPGEELNEVIVNWVKRKYHWDIRPEWLVYISGVVPAVNVALKSFAGEENNVILQPPVYYPFFSAVRKSSAKLIENQLKYENGRYCMDFSGLEDILSKIAQKDTFEISHHSKKIWIEIKGIFLCYAAHIIR